MNTGVGVKKITNPDEGEKSLLSGLEGEAWAASRGPWSLRKRGGELQNEKTQRVACSKRLNPPPECPSTPVHPLITEEEFGRSRGQADRGKEKRVIRWGHFLQCVEKTRGRRA